MNDQEKAITYTSSLIHPSIHQYQNLVISSNIAVNYVWSTINETITNKIKIVVGHWVIYLKMKIIIVKDFVGDF